MTGPRQPGQAWPRFLANTGFLFRDLPFPDRLGAAARAGFDGVEFHDEVQRHDTSAIAATLAETGLSVGALNIRMGETAGCAALKGAERAFVADMQSAHAAAQAVRARAIHVLAGRGETDRSVYLDNLRRALDLTDRQILIEPICAQALPGYHLQSLQDALDVQQRLGSARVAILFDWYHIAMAGDVAQAAQALSAHRDKIGHVQLASVPGRQEPARAMIAHTAALGFAALGFEYHPSQPEAHALPAFRQALDGGDQGNPGRP